MSGSNVAPYDPPPAVDTGTADPGTKRGTGKGQGTQGQVLEASSADPTDAATDDASDSSTTQTYLTSSEPVETQSAPLWVVPGILLMLTSMLALLGGVLGRNKRPVKDEA